jgi:hypothetical protein
MRARPSVWLYGLAIKSLGGVEAVLPGVKPLHIIVEGHLTCMRTRALT